MQATLRKKIIKTQIRIFKNKTVNAVFTPYAKLIKLKKFDCPEIEDAGDYTTINSQGQIVNTGHGGVNTKAIKTYIPYGSIPVAEGNNHANIYFARDTRDVTVLATSTTGANYDSTKTFTNTLKYRSLDSDVYFR